MSFHCIVCIILIFLTFFLQPGVSASDSQPANPSAAGSAQDNSDKTKAQKSTFLYGRIEQLTDEDGGTPKLRLPDAKTKSNEDSQPPSSETKALSGKVIEDYPDKFPLHWGGHIELTKTSAKSESFVPGLNGNIRFDFQRSKHGLVLKPPAALFWVPLRTSHCGSVASAMLSQGQPAYLHVSTKEGPFWSGKAYRLRPEDLDRPIVAVSMNLGLHGEKRTALSGSRWKVEMVQDTLRQLDPETFEQDAIALLTPSSPAGKEYEEQVIRLRLNDDKNSMSVKIADLHYDSARTFQNQTDYEGTITAGEDVDTRLRGYYVLSSPNDDGGHYLFH
jgi:hypothetical protein